MSNYLAEKQLLSNYSKKEILKELDCILSSDLFSRSTVLSNFLKFIVEETLQGNTERLKEYTIAINVFGKAADFNPQSNAIVRINAGRVRRLLNEYYEGLGIKNPLKIEVVKGTYVPLFRAQSVNLVTDYNDKFPSNNNNNNNNNTVNYSRSKLTLAVLPFRNLLPDDEYKFFVDGFGEELTRIFSTSEEIAVVAHFSTLKYATYIGDIRTVGADLGVHYVIMGSVKRSAKKIRVSVAMVETMNGTQIWSKDYSHDLEKDKIMDIQDQIDNDVFAILSGHYGFIVCDNLRTIENDVKQDLQTFDAVLWLYRAELTHSKDDYIKSIKGLEKALENNPNNALCLVILGDAYLSSYALGYTIVENPIDEAYKLIKKALLISPSSQYTHAIHGWANIYLGKKKEAIEAIAYSLQLAPPSPSTKGALGFGFCCAGEYKRGLALLEEALDLNPHCPWWYYMAFFFVYYQSGKYEEALAYTQKMDASEDVYLIPLLSVAVKGQLGMIADAQLEAEVLQQHFSQILSNLKMYLSAFVLDAFLVDEIISGVRKAGLTIA